MKFPIISLKDFSSEFDKISKEIFKASQEWGFFILKDHGIDGINQMFDRVMKYITTSLDHRN
jgi:isopenicillin N synthase-like dioxygenase